MLQYIGTQIVVVQGWKILFSNGVFFLFLFIYGQITASVS